MGDSGGQLLLTQGRYARDALNFCLRPPKVFFGSLGPQDEKYCGAKRRETRKVLLIETTDHILPSGDKGWLARVSTTHPRPTISKPRC